MLGTIGHGTAAPPILARTQPSGIGPAADLLRVPAAAAGRAGAVQRPDPPGAETASSGRERLPWRVGADAGA